MKNIRIDDARIPEAMEIIEKAASLMEERDCENDPDAKMELAQLQNRLRELSGNKKLEINTGLANLTDYIFYPNLVGLDMQATLEQIADKIIVDRT